MTAARTETEFVLRPERLAAMMFELQARGCHNANFVTPEHVVPQILEAIAVEGDCLPLVYNTSTGIHTTASSISAVVILCPRYSGLRITTRPARR